MTDDVDNTSKKRFEITRFVVLSGWIVTIVICAILVLASTYMTVILKTEPPSPLKDHAGLALGFLFGSFVGLVKDFIQIK